MDSEDVLETVMFESRGLNEEEAAMTPLREEDFKQKS